MSSAPHGDRDPMAPHYRPAPEGNSIGLIGFVLSLVGLVGCCFQPAALLSLAGLVLSIIGMNRRPRGLAIAGIVLGVIGLSGFLIVFLMVGVAVIALVPLMLVGAALAGPEPSTRIEMAVLETMVESYIDETGSIPTDLSQFSSRHERLEADHWGTPYELEVTDTTPGDEDFIIRSAGPDKVFGTPDDLTSDD